MLVQPEMERRRSPLVSIPPPQAGIFKASMRPPGYPSAWSAQPASVSPGEIIVTPPRPLVPISGWLVIRDSVRPTGVGKCWATRVEAFPQTMFLDSPQRASVSLEIPPDTEDSY
jgi:hypothetical protein